MKRSVVAVALSLWINVVQITLTNHTRHTITSGRDVFGIVVVNTQRVAVLSFIFDLVLGGHVAQESGISSQGAFVSDLIANSAHVVVVPNLVNLTVVGGTFPPFASTGIVVACVFGMFVDETPPAVVLAFDPRTVRKGW